MRSSASIVGRALALIAAAVLTPSAAFAAERAQSAQGASGAQGAPNAQAAPKSERAEAPPIDPTKEVFWTNAEVGVQSLQLRTFVADTDSLVVGFLPDNATGPAMGLGAGIRIVFLTLGARGRVAMFHDDTPGRTVGNWQLWTLDAELGFRIPLHRFEPYLTFSGGYAAIGGLSQAVAGLSQGLDVNGVDARMGLGFDYYLSRHLTFGVLLGGELLFLSRPGVSVRDLATAKQVGTLNEAKARLLEANGSSVGSALALTTGLGVHF